MYTIRIIETTIIREEWRLGKWVAYCWNAYPRNQRNVPLNERSWTVSKDPQLFRCMIITTMDIINIPRMVIQTDLSKGTRYLEWMDEVFGCRNKNRNHGSQVIAVKSPYSILPVVIRYGVIMNTAWCRTRYPNSPVTFTSASEALQVLVLRILIEKLKLFIIIFNST